jgi:hypothetical protein
MIAVPYLGTGGSKLLPLKKGDVLICALSEANARNGSVNPFEIKKLQRRRVKVYQEEDLHAKVYLFGRTAVIGSANLSKSSMSQLDEVGLLTRESKVIYSIKAWFNDRLSKPVTPEWLSYCVKVYRPPKNEKGRRNKGKGSMGPKLTPSLWMVQVNNIDFPEFEDRARQKGHNTALKHLDKPYVYEIEEIRWTGKPKYLERFKRGDLVVQVWNKNGSDKRVCPHARFLGKKETKTKTGGLATYHYLEMPKKYRTISWKKFRNICKDFGLRFNLNLVVREIRNRSLIRNLTSLVSPERLMIKKRGRA